MSTTIRVSEQTLDRLAALARTTGNPMTKVVDDAVDALERKVFFDLLNQRYSELNADPVTRTEIEAERSLQDGTLRDTSP